jgi:putative peptidoglycan lipid II flippase
VLNKIFTPAYYARENMRTPMVFTIINAAVNVTGSLILFSMIGVVGIAISTAAAGWVNAILLAGALYRNGMFRPSARTGRRSLMIMAGSVLMGVGLWLIANYFGAPLLDGSVLLRIGLVATLVLAGCVIYFAFVLSTGVFDLRELRSLVKKKREGA